MPLNGFKVAVSVIRGKSTAKTCSIRDYKNIFLSEHFSIFLSCPASSFCFSAILSASSRMHLSLFLSLSINRGQASLLCRNGYLTKWTIHLLQNLIVTNLYQHGDFDLTANAVVCIVVTQPVSSLVKHWHGVYMFTLSTFIM